MKSAALTDMSKSYEVQLEYHLYHNSMCPDEGCETETGRPIN